MQITVPYSAVSEIFDGVLARRLGHVGLGDGCVPGRVRRALAGGPGSVERVPGGDSELAEEFDWVKTSKPDATVAERLGYGLQCDPLNCSSS